MYSIGELSNRQKQVLELLAHGRSSKEIGKMLDASPETIRKHISNIRDILGMRRAAELAAYWHVQNSTDSSMDSAPSSAQECLTAREREVAKLLLNGLSTKEAARVLDIAPGTVAKHRENMYKKLDINKVCLLSFRLGWGWQIQV